MVREKGSVAGCGVQLHSQIKTLGCIQLSPNQSGPPEIKEQKAAVFINFSRSTLGRTSIKYLPFIFTKLLTNVFKSV